MPIFEFSCQACGLRFEKLTKIGEEHNIKCPACDSGEVKKEFSIFSSAGSATSSGNACFSGG
ncbi:MAG: zinc ribbon domain-containing protein [Geobacter sp.]|nr:MAG: zinc ribbon domain-containing protein [Geobacter sp.]